MGSFSIVTSYLPPRLRTSIGAYCREKQFTPEEIRLRRGQAPCLRIAGEEYCCGPEVTGEELSALILAVTGGSLHCAQDYLSQGYLPLPEGGRMGICGLGRGYALQGVSSVCIRLPRMVPGCADAVLAQICQPDFHSTLLISPPGLGKTTLLREMIRRLSYSGKYVGVCDERGELSGAQKGGTGFDLGPRTDVCPMGNREDSAMQLLRTMSPDILAMDELTAARDRQAVLEAMGCGVQLLSTVHGASVQDLQRPGFRPILELGAFSYAVIISQREGQRNYTVQRL